MPELPEVETVRTGLEPVLTGVRIDRVTLRRRKLRMDIPQDLAVRVTGAVITKLRRRSKYILMDTDRQDTILLHLGMSGSVTIYRAGQPVPARTAHDHIDIETAAGDTILYNDPRRFGILTIFQSAQEETHKLLAHLGPEPLSNAFHEAHLQKALAGKQSSTKAALLDQKTVAGLGNIYVCEALWRARISPRRRAANTVGVRAARLFPHIRAVLEEAIAAGGSSLKDFKNTDGTMGYFQHRFDVYDREGEACRRSGCGGQITRLVQSGRSSYYCPRCQR